MRLAFLAEAAAELAAAAEAYERAREGYGDLFIREVRAKVQRAARFPASGVPVTGFPSELDVRRFGLRRFPFSVVTARVAGTRVVIAVAHAKRAPGYWRGRVK